MWRHGGNSEGGEMELDSGDDFNMDQWDTGIGKAGDNS
jgi:hypothetical protein